MSLTRRDRQPKIEAVRNVGTVTVPQLTHPFGERPWDVPAATPKTITIDEW